VKKCLVLTTVNKPSEAVRRFIRTDYDVIVVGDRKTPGDYRSLDCVFLDLRAQHKQFRKISKHLPLDSYSRKNIGYLYAIRNGYDVIAESDDDNIAYDDWGRLDQPARGRWRTVTAPAYPNMYSLYTGELIWPRGFPLEKIHAGEDILAEEKDADVFIVQSLADGDPDVDAVFRLVLGGRGGGREGGREFVFDRPEPGKGAWALDKGVLSPFNSQNTFWINRAAFPYLYLPATVPFRCCDIVRGYVAQHGIWRRGGQLAFTAASVRQHRNPHDLIEDFRSETPLYLHFHKMMEAVNSAALDGGDGDLLAMYRALHKAGLVAKHELRLVREWLKLAAETSAPLSGSGAS